MQEDDFTLTDEMDHTILMQRDAHFGGDFSVMLNYYADETHIGIDPEVEIERICYLQAVEKEMGKDLAPLMLSIPEAEKIATCRQAYIHLKEVYDHETPSLASRIADLILAENEDPRPEIEAVVACGSHIVPELIHLLKSDAAYDPLYPGYGYAPYLAIVCLGEIKDPQAVRPLFEVFHKETLFEESPLIDAFALIGKPAKDFLLECLQARPITTDNMHAAFGLSAFSLDIDVAQIAMAQLQDVEVQKKHLLVSYLICLCDALSKSDDKERFMAMKDDLTLPLDLRQEIKSLIHDWKS